MLLEALDGDETVAFAAAAGKHGGGQRKVASQATSVLYEHLLCSLACSSGAHSRDAANIIS